jgi:hypothetical protein
MLGCRGGGRRGSPRVESPPACDGATTSCRRRSPGAWRARAGRRGRIGRSRRTSSERRLTPVEAGRASSSRSFLQREPLADEVIRRPAFSDLLLRADPFAGSTVYGRAKDCERLRTARTRSLAAESVRRTTATCRHRAVIVGFSPAFAGGKDLGRISRLVDLTCVNGLSLLSLEVFARDSRQGA